MRTLLLAVLAYASIGCASVTIDQPAKGANSVVQPEDGRNVGITYYEPMFVLVVSCSEGKASAEIKTMPDYSKPRVVRWHNGLFTNAHPSVTLGDGWRLDGFDSEVTSTMGDVAGAVGTVAAAAIALAGLDTGGTMVVPLPAGIYRIDGANGRWQIDVENPIIRLGECVKSKAPTEPAKPEPKPSQEPARLP